MPGVPIVTVVSSAVPGSRVLRVVVGVLCLLTSHTAFASISTDDRPSLPWEYDIERAKKIAKKTDKILFVLFTGSDWVPPARRLEREVLTQAAFVERASGEFVYLLVDFPQGELAKAKVIDAKANESFRKRYGVPNLPTVLLTTADGLPLAHSGYRPGGQQKYWEHVQELRQRAIEIQSLLATERAEPDRYLRALGWLFEAGLLGDVGYADLRRKALAMDEGGELGLAALVRGAEELVGLLELVRSEPKPNAALWRRVADYIATSKHLAGLDFCGVGFDCALALMHESRYAEAKVILERVHRDPSLADAKSDRDRVAEKIRECRDKLRAD